MKRAFIIVMCIVMLVPIVTFFSGCEDDAIATQGDVTTTTTTVQSTATTAQPTTVVNNEESTVEQTTVQSGGMEQTSTSTTIGTDKTTSATVSAITTTTTTATTKATTKTTTKPSTIANTTTIKKHLIDYSIADWFVDNDDIHILIHRHNPGSGYVPGRYFVMDANTGEITKDFSIVDNPCDMLKRNGEIWISYTDLQSVYVYDANTFTVKRVIYLGEKVTNFAVCGDYLLYSCYGNYSNVRRYNMVTKDVAYIESYVRYDEEDTRWGKFCSPSMVVDEQKGWVYIGDRGFADAGVFCFDVESLELRSYYWKSREITNDLDSKMYLYDGKLYWAACEFDANDLSTILRSFGTSDSTRALFYVGDKYVLTRSAIFDRRTGLVRKVTQSALSQFGIWVVTDSGNALECEYNVVVKRRLVFTAGKYRFN